VHAFDVHLFECPNCARDRSRAVLAPDDEFADQVVVVLADGVARLVPAVESHAEAVGQLERADRAGRGEELAARRVLRVDTHFDGVSATKRVHLLLSHRQFLAVGDANLPLDEVDAGDHLRDRVLDLQSRVHLEEEEVAVLVDELDRAGVVVTHGSRGLDRCFAHGLFDAVRQRRRGCLFDQFLMATLGGTVAQRDPHDVAVLVADQLHLDVSRPREVSLDVDLVATEERFRLSLGGVHRLLHRGGVLDHFHTATAAAECRLDGDWPAVLFAELHDFRRAVDELGGTRHDRCAAAQRGLAGRHLVSHFDDGGGRRPDEGHAQVGDGLGEVGVLREKAVAGVHGVGAALADGIEDRLGIEVTLGRGLAAEGVRLVGQSHVQGVAVEFGIDGDGGNAHLAGGANDANGDFSAVGDQDFLRHEHLSCEGNDAFES